MFFKTESEKFSRLLESLRDKKVAVIGHLRPDGDCIGSQIALCRVLRSRGIDTVCVNRDKVPFNLTDFVEDTPFFTNETFKNDGRVIVAVDCSDRSRLGEALLEKHFAGTPIFAVIDHHQSHNGDAGQSIVVPTAAATCFLLAAMLIDNGIAFDGCTARALYAGIVTDTGRFQYSSTDETVFEVAGTLIRNGADAEQIGRRIYGQEKYGTLKLLGRFLETVRLCADGKLALAYIPKDAYEQTGTSPEDTETFVNYLKNLAGVAIACKLEQSTKSLKGSLRANGDRYRVDLLAAKLAGTFGGNGGGHKQAAGFSLDGLDLEKDRERVFEQIREWLENPQNF
ncbi:MAG: bifunctional oligoribonuclease/PAP phosphatase NrnA [Opitutales bacterium]|nr:bifunctional oligoribonuclease/PAP phosphatase NrnA [Opitutales bacterium]